MLCALRGEFSVEGFINPKLILCLLCGMKSLVSFFIFARPCSESVVMPRPLARVCGLYCR